MPGPACVARSRRRAGTHRGAPLPAWLKATCTAAGTVPAYDTRTSYPVLGCSPASEHLRRACLAADAERQGQLGDAPQRVIAQLQSLLRQRLADAEHLCHAWPPALPERARFSGDGTAALQAALTSQSRCCAPLGVRCRRSLHSHVATPRCTAAPRRPRPAAACIVRECVAWAAACAAQRSRGSTLRQRRRQSAINTTRDKEQGEGRWLRRCRLRPCAHAHAATASDLSGGPAMVACT